MANPSQNTANAYPVKLDKLEKKLEISMPLPWSKKENTTPPNVFYLDAIGVRKEYRGFKS